MCNLELLDKYIFAAIFEKQPFKKISKIKMSSEAAIRMHFSISLFCTYSEIFGKITVTECDFSIFSRLACNAPQP